MDRRFEGLLLGLFAYLFLHADHAEGAETDVNIVTAMDISDSMEPADIETEIHGLALAIRSRVFLEAIQAGPNGRVGFAVFAWHSGQSFPEFVPWTVIASEADAERVAAQLVACLALTDRAMIRTPNELRNPSGLTDISGAIQYGASLMRLAPFTTNRSVVNVIGNGDDNVRDGPREARDALIAEGVTINGVVFGGDPSLLDYFHREVVGGPGSFLLSVLSAETVVSLLVRKLQLDIVADASAERAARSPRQSPAL